MSRSTRGALLAHVAPRWFGLAVVVVELDAMIEFRRLQRDLERAPPAAAGAFLAAVIAGWALAERTAVRDLLLSRRHAALWRQPVDGPAWGPAAVAVLAPLALPVGVAAGFW
ncbi:MAG: hypothetical protein ABMB14_18160, partial [Myxococcota bacterium]